MFSIFNKFHNDEEGAVTVDFVVLTAAIVVLGLAVGTAISNGATGLANEVDDSLDAQGVGVVLATSDAITAAAGN